MSTLEDSEISHSTPTETSGYAHKQVGDMNNTSVKDDGADNQPPPAVDVTTPTKHTPTPPVRILSREKSSPVAPPTPSTPKTPMTQEGIRYKTLFEELKMRYRTKQEEIKQLKDERGKSEKETNELRDLVAAFKKQNERLVQQCGELTVQKDNVLGERPSKLCYGLHKVKSDDNIIRLKPKAKKTRTTNDGEILKCEYGSCGNENVDLIKCNMCDKWVCEDCNDVQVAKLKPIVNKCKTIHFLCKTCDEKIGCSVADLGDVQIQPAEESTLLTSMKNMLDKKVAQIETKFEKVIDKKLGEKMSVIQSLNEKIENNMETTVTENPSYAKVLQVPAEVRKIMEEARNDAKVERVEQEKRSQNFIIHGAEEVGDNADDINKNDAQYIQDILRKLTVSAEPESITRLGQPNDRKMRTLKIVMKSCEDKELVMGNLRKLKGTEEVFGKISVTHDYSNTDREKIKEFATKARLQGQQDPTRIYKVRGDPKNGLRIISYKKN